MLHVIAQSDSGGAGVLVVWLVIFGGLLAFMWYRQRTRATKRQEFLSTLDVGDQVRTIGGLLGRIEQLDDDVAVVRTADGVKLHFARGAIAEKTGSGDEA